jgi:hypothetical protein
MRSYFKGVARDGGGIIVKSATISVFEAGSTTAANVYTSLTETTPVNSVTASAAGVFEFWVSRFDYDQSQTFKLVISKSGYTSVTWDNVEVKDVVLGTYTISADTTVTTELKPPKGVMYSIDSGKTLTINGPFGAGDYPVFAGSGAVAGIRESNPMWFGATGDGATDDSTAFTSSINALADGGKWFVPAKTFKVANIVFDVEGATIEMLGTLSPVAGTTGYTLCIGSTTANAMVNNIQGNVRISSGSYGSHADYANVEGLRIENLNASSIVVNQVKGCKYGIRLMGNGATTGSAAYNNFYLGTLIDNQHNIHFENIASGWANENKFYGGRFTHNTAMGGSYNTYCHIYIPADATHEHNGNVFYSPSFEGTYQWINCEGHNNAFLDVRMETSSGTWGSDMIYLGASSYFCTLTANAMNNLNSNMITRATAGVGGVTITHDDSMNAFVINGAGDLKEYFYPGSYASFTVDGSAEEIIVVASAYAAPNLYVWHTRSGQWTSANTVTIARSTPIYNGSNSNSILKQYATTATDSMLNLHGKGMDYMWGHLVINGMADSTFPVLTLATREAAANIAFQILNNSYVRKLWGDGNGNLLLKGTIYKNQASPTAKTTGVTLTIAELLTGIITGTQSSGANVNYQLPTGTDADTGTVCDINQAFDWTLTNLSAAAVDTITLTANTDHTIVGNAIVQSAHATTGGIYGNSATFRTRKTAANTFVTYRIN